MWPIYRCGQLIETGSGRRWILIYGDDLRLYMAGSILLPLPEEEARMLNEVNDEAEQVEKERVATETVRHAKFERL